MIRTKEEKIRKEIANKILLRENNYMGIYVKDNDKVNDKITRFVTKMVYEGVDKGFQEGKLQVKEEEINFLQELPIGNLKPANDSETLKTPNAYVYTMIKERLKKLQEKK